MRLRLVILAVACTAMWSCGNGDNVVYEGGNAGGAPVVVAPPPPDECLTYCGKACKAATTCSLVEATATCEADCESALSGGKCHELAVPDQQSCTELETSFACIRYCDALCDRAPSCGSFDTPSCKTGCNATAHPICNATSVPARTCDQLKPEAREFQELGSDTSVGADIFVNQATSFGLCGTGGDCPDPEGCSARTNTCGACASDAECAGKKTMKALACGANHQCVTVECLTDADCMFGYCASARHACVQCTKDDQCKSAGGVACDPNTNTCTT